MAEEDPTRNLKNQNNVTWASFRIGGNNKQDGVVDVSTLGSLSFSSPPGDSRIFVPWSRSYKIWWGFTIVWSVLTIFFETYQIAFSGAGWQPPHNDPEAIFEYLFSAVFLADIFVNFNLAYYGEADHVVYDRKLIAKRYFRLMFWVDVVGVFPFYAFALACAGELGQNNKLTSYLGLLRLFRMVRLHRVKQLFDILQYNTKVSFMWLTLIRNFGAALVWTHFAACVMYFIARQYDFDEDNTWIGSSLSGLTGAERYLTSLYWSVVTFTTVGYGDFSPVNAAEQVWDMLYMLLNMIFMAWIIGSMTLLIVKNDEQTSEYRDVVKQLTEYSKLNSFDKKFQKRLKSQIKLSFHQREVSDEEVLSHFPGSIRRKVLRRLYLPSLMNTSLLKDIRQQFVNQFVTKCSVEVFGPGEEIVTRGTISMDLYLLVNGEVELMPLGNTDDSVSARWDSKKRGGATGTSIADSDARAESASSRVVGAGEFINEIGFFTESPQTDTVRTRTLCKTLTMSRSAYKMLIDDHPGSSGKLLQNLLTKVETIAEELGSDPSAKLTKGLNVLNAGSVYDISTNDTSAHSVDMKNTVAAAQTEAALTSLRDLVTMHINKQKDDHTTKFLFAASREDIPTITIMCDQNFDPNSADYDSRTALMVASSKGHSDTVSKLLEYQANPNLSDMHGSTALLDAVKSGHEGTMKVLLEHKAELCLKESQAASILCQAVSDGDMLLLRRLLKAGIDINAGDYDKRTAAHIAAAEGNVAALNVLVEHGADLTVKDRWNNSIHDEGKNSRSGPMMDFIKSLV